MSLILTNGTSRRHAKGLRSVDELGAGRCEGDDARYVSTLAAEYLEDEGHDTDASHTDDEGNEKTRALGLIVARGTLLVLISPVDGSEEIANPFAQAEDE